MADCSSVDSIIETAALINLNGQKIDKFTNGTATETVQLGAGAPTPTLRKLVQDVYDDSSFVHKTGDETVAGTKTFTSDIVGNVTGTATDVVNSEDATDSASLRGLFSSDANVFGTDLNSYVKSGFYYVSSLTDNKPKSSISNGFLIVIASSSGNIKQIFSRYGTMDSNDHETYVRTRSTVLVWSSWHKVLVKDSAAGWYALDGEVIPYTNNTYSLGSASYLWKEIFCANSTINTSDARLKQDVDAVPDEVLDAWSDVDFKQFKFKDAVESKGDSARLHNGLVAQRIAEIFNAHGLDASRYGFFCHDAWDASETEDGTVPAGDLYSLRYIEALCMEAAYQRRENARLKARLEALEEKVNG